MIALDCDMTMGRRDYRRGSMITFRQARRVNCQNNIQHVIGMISLENDMGLNYSPILACLSPLNNKLVQYVITFNILLCLVK